MAAVSIIGAQNGPNCSLVVIYLVRFCAQAIVYWIYMIMMMIVSDVVARRFEMQASVLCLLSHYDPK